MKLRLEVSQELGSPFECVEQPSGTSCTTRLRSLAARAAKMTRAALCRIGFHRMVMDEERSCCWGGIDRCSRCGKEEHWSNSYR